YDTTVLSGERKAGCRCPFDLYEMYWADLSRLGAGYSKVFGELFQLLFHLTGLGRKTVDLERLNHSAGFRQRIWSAYAWFQAAASEILSVPMPMIYLVMLAVILS